MRALSVAFAVVLALATATPALAQVGVDHDGKMYISAVEQYLMCGKCTYYTSGSTNSGGTYYKLSCNGPKATPNSFSWIDYGCNDGCTTCSSSVNVTMGGLIKASYSTWATYFESSVTTVKLGAVAATFQCCPKVAKTIYHSDSTCAASTSVSYSPSGCAGTDAAISGKAWFGSYCTSDGAIPSTFHMSCTADAALSPGESCPSDTSKCLASMSMSNDPCLTLNGVAGLYGSRSISCQVDESQMCLRTVLYPFYTSNMTNSEALTGLQCGSGAAATAAFLALVVAVFAIFA